MATALASRPAPVRMRRPAGSVVQPVRQPRSKSKSSSQPTERPDLRLVESIPVKRFSLVTSALIVIAFVLTSIVVFQTVIAEQQLRLDKITTDVRLARIEALVPFDLAREAPLRAQLLQRQDTAWTLPKSVLGKDGVFAPVVFPAP